MLRDGALAVVSLQVLPLQVLPEVRMLYEYVGRLSRRVAARPSVCIPCASSAPRPSRLEHGASFASFCS